jgi:hypothetical protein
MQTQLESLANETLLTLWEFIPPLDLFRAFSGLNSRLNNLIFVGFRVYRFDFRSISKEDLNIICRIYFPLIIDQIISLRFSDDDDTPRQSADFLSYNFNLIQSFLKIKQLFFIETPNLHNLTHLKFVDCDYDFDSTIDSVQLINQIWSLSKLIYCYWDLNLYTDECFVIPTVVSSSLQHLYIHHITWKFDKLVSLMEKTPHLQYFSTTAKFTYASDVRDHTDKTPPLSMNLAMRKFKLHGASSPRLMINTLYRMPNLSFLNIESSFISFDGYQWKTIITNYLPKLKIFRLIMIYYLDDSMNKENEIDQLLDTYRTSFWIEEHQWYMGCLWNSSNDNSTICLYSLPYSFQVSSKNSSQGVWRTKSTYLPKIKYSYDHVRCLTYHDSSVFTNTEFSNIELNHVQNLDLTLPFDNRFLSIFTHFDNLLWLGIRLSDDYPFQLQFLIDKAPRLLELEFYVWSTEEIPPFNITSTSVRRLNLRGRDEFYNAHCFDRHQCITLSQSPLGIQCQVLHIEVKSPLGIVERVYKMINLRTLRVRYMKDSRSHKPDVLKWLQSRVPTASVVIRRNYPDYIIRL